MYIPNVYVQFSTVVLMTLVVKINFYGSKNQFLK